MERKISTKLGVHFIVTFRKKVSNNFVFHFPFNLHKSKVVFPAFIWSLSSQLIIFIFSQDALTCYKYIWLKLKLSKIYKVMTLTWFVVLLWRKILLKSCNSFHDEVFYLFSLLICWTMICFLYFMELEDEFVWTTIRRWLPSLGQNPNYQA